MVLTFVTAALDWNSTPLLDWTGFIPGLPLGLGGLFVTVCGYFNLGLGNTYCGSDGLVTGGIYRYLRHPIYASLWLAAIAQVLMLPNWIAGWGGIMSALLVQWVRVPREEQMMLSAFGDQYRDYMQRTGRFFPKL